MRLFSAHSACFSPSVLPQTIHAWVNLGGTIARSQHRRNANFYFCAGNWDPWLPDLLKNAIAVFDAQWILVCADANFRMPCAPYILDKPCIQAEQDTEDEEVVRTLLHTTTTTTAAVVDNPRKRRFEEDDEGDHPDDDDRRPTKKLRPAPPPLPPPPPPPAKTKSSNSNPRVKSVRVVRFSPTPTNKTRTKGKIREIDFRNVPIRTRTEFVYEKRPDLRRPLHPSHHRLPTPPPSPWSVLLKQRTQVVVDSDSDSDQTAAPPRMSVQEALKALRDVRKDRCVLFVPAQVCCGKTFRCFNVDG